MKKIPQFIAVVHVKVDTLAMKQIDIALSNGAGGVFLIDHQRTHSKLRETYRHARRLFPSAWIGLNFLDLSARKAMETAPDSVDGIWMDHVDQSAAEWAAADARPFATFAGCAFKYQEQPDDLAAAAMECAKHFDVVTTSGPGTGQEANPQKIEMMRKAIHSHPLALASGVTPENVASYLPFVDHFLVATGISTSFDTLNPMKVQQLARVLSVAARGGLGGSLTRAVESGAARSTGAREAVGRYVDQLDTLQAQGRAKRDAPCDHFVEDPAICDDFGQPKGQCVCGAKESEHQSPGESDIQLWTRAIIDQGPKGPKVSFVTVEVCETTASSVKVKLRAGSQFAWYNRKEARVYPDLETCKAALLEAAEFERDDALSAARYWEAVIAALPKFKATHKLAYDKGVWLPVAKQGECWVTKEGQAFGLDSVVKPIKHAGN